MMGIHQTGDGYLWHMQKEMSSTNVGLSYLLTVGLVSFTRYSLLPWFLWDLNQRKYNSWTKAVPAYGVLLSCLQCGHAFGQLLVNLNFTSSSLYSFAFFILTSSYLGICFINRFYAVALLLFLLGFAGSVLSGVSINLDQSSTNVSFVRKPTESELSNNVERSILFFVFSTLISGFMYNMDPFTPFPMKHVAILVCVGCVLICIYFMCIRRAVKQKFKAAIGGKVISKSGIGSNSSGNYTSPTGFNNSNNQSGDVITPGNQWVGDMYIPNSFMMWYNNDLTLAAAAYRRRMQWRADEQIDEIMDIPQNGFHNVLQYYPHAIHGYSLDGCVVVYELLGRGDVGGLKKSGVTIKELVQHFCMRNELVFERLLEPSFVEQIARKYPQAIDTQLYEKNNPKHIRRLMTVLDCKGLSLSSISTDVVSFIKQSGDIIDAYFPCQVARLVIVNAPWGFSTIWAGLARALPDSVKKKVDILNDTAGLERYIHHSMRSTEYSGSSDVPLGQSEGHLAFLKLAENWKNHVLNGTTVLGGSCDMDPPPPKPAASATAVAAAVSFSSSSAATATASMSVSAGGSILPSTATADNVASGNSNSGGGVMGWLKTRLGGGSGSNGGAAGGSSKSSAPKTAYLGEKNSYRYNPVTGTWVLGFDDQDHDHGQAGEDSDNEDEEIVTFTSSGNAHGSSGGGGGRARGTLPSVQKNTSIIMGGGATTSAASTATTSSTATQRANAKNNSSNSTNSNNNSNSASKTSKRSEKDKDRNGKGKKKSSNNNNSNNNNSGSHRRSDKSRHSSTSSSSSSAFPSSNGADGGSISGCSTPRMTDIERIEQEGLIYATQVAQLHSSGNMRDLEAGGLIGGYSSSGFSSSSSSTLAAQQQAMMFKQQSKSSAVDDITLSRVSSDIFLLVACMHVISAVLQCIVFTLIPVWLLSVISTGGMSYRVQDLALVLSTSGMITLYTHSHLSLRLEYCLKASPVRTLRIAAGMLIILCFLLPMYVSIATYTGTDMDMRGTVPHVVMNTHIRGGRVVFTDRHSDAVVVPDVDTHIDVMKDFHFIGPSHVHTNDGPSDNVNYYSPTHSIVALIATSVLLSALTSAVYVCRKATNILFHLTLHSSFTSPSTLRSIMNHLIDIVTPFCACLIFAAVYSLRARYPMNSAFFLSMTACGMMAVYVGSLFLTVQFRGDYGVMTDSNDHALAVSGGGDMTGGQGGYDVYYGQQGQGQGQLRARNSSGYTPLDSYPSGGGSHRGGAISSSPAPMSAHDLFHVPVGDLNLLFSQIGYSYGSKLYNLRDDFKDL